jgi:subtilisin family serine protease
MNRALDPRLRQLVERSADPLAVAEDIRLNRVREVEDAVHVSVLARVSGEPPDVPGSRWIPVAGGVYAVDLPVTELTALAEHPDVQYVEAGRTLGPELNTSLPATKADLLHQPSRAHPTLTGAGVVVGIVDSGLDFTLDDFRHEDGTTRVAFLWDQTLRPQGNEHAPAGFGTGVEYEADAINTALKADFPFTVVRHKPSPGAHGTHVTGIAAGNGRSADTRFPSGTFIGAAPQATIIFVQPAFGQEAGTLTDSVAVSLAVSYIYAKAAALGLPCVINMSLSQNGGSHDGSSLLEATIDQLVENRSGRAFVQAAGNVQVWRNHASGVLAAGETRTLRWKCGGGLPVPSGQLPEGADPTPNELEIWYSPRDTLAVRLINPSGEATESLAPESRTSHRFRDGTVALLDSIRFSPLSGDAQVFVSVQRGTAATVPSGVWQVELTATQVRDGRFDAWIERDEQDPPFLQSFFMGADFDPVMTLGTPATSRRGISVANYDHRTESVHFTSSRGRTRDGRAKPDLAAPGVKILSAHALGGQPDGAGGTFPMRVAKTGTSMAAPHVTGIVALLLQHDPSLTAPQITKLLTASANPATGITGFDLAWGYGRVDTVAAVELLG